MTASVKKRGSPVVNTVIVGCGAIARNRHIPSLLACPGASLYGFYSATYENAARLADQYRAKVFRTLADVLSDPAVDAIVVCTPTRTHCDITVKALEAGKHVLCEKPMAANALEARRMAEAAARTGKKLMISHNQRLYKPHVMAKELLDHQALGRILTFRTSLGTRGPEYYSVDRSLNNWYFRKEQAGRGVLSDVGCHRIDLMIHFFGEIDQVMACTATLDKRKPDGSFIDLDDNAFVIMKFKNGIMGTLATSWTSYSGNDRMTQIFGTEGVMTLYAGTDPLLIETRRGEKIRYDLGETPAQDVIVVTDIVSRFIACIENDTEPFVSGREGLSVIEALDAMALSSATGQWVTVSST